MCSLVCADEYLDAYHSIDASVEVLMRSLRDNPPQTAGNDGDDDDYEDDDYYDDYEEDDDDDVETVDEDDDHYVYDNYNYHFEVDDDRSEEEEDESILDEDVDRNVNRDDEGTYSNCTKCEISCG